MSRLMLVFRYGSSDIDGVIADLLLLEPSSGCCNGASGTLEDNENERPTGASSWRWGRRWRRGKRNRWRVSRRKVRRRREM